MIAFDQPARSLPVPHLGGVLRRGEGQLLNRSQRHALTPAGRFCACANTACSVTAARSARYEAGRSVTVWNPIHSPTSHAGERVSTQREATRAALGSVWEGGEQTLPRRVYPTVVGGAHQQIRTGGAALKRSKKSA